MPDDERPGYFARTQQLNKAGVVPTPATGTDVFSMEPGEPSVPMLNPRCEPRPLNLNTLTRILTNDTEILLGRLTVPNGAQYSAFDIQWWVDYPLLVELGFVQVYFRYGGGGEQDVMVPFPTMYPARFCREFERGEVINVFARVGSPFPLSGATGTPIYIGCSAQLGYERSQFATLAFKGTDLVPVGTKRTTLIVAPGAALVNPFALPSLVARRVRVIWPLVTGVAAAGRILVTTSSEAGAPQAPAYVIDQALGNLAGANSLEVWIGDMRELWIGNPPPATALLAPASVTIEWEQWRTR